MGKTIEIPEGYEARIEGNKVIIELKESEDERIYNLIHSSIKFGEPIASPKNKELALAYLERQKDKDKYPEFCVRSDCTGCSIYEKQKKQKPIYNLEIPAGDVAPAEEDGPFDEDEFLENELSAFLKNYDKEYDDDAIVSDVAKHFYEIGKKQKEHKSVQDKDEREYVSTLKSLVADFVRNSDGILDLIYYQEIYDWLDGRHIEKQLSTAEDIAAAYQMGLAEGRKEQKPTEWSEEDEALLKEIVSFFKDGTTKLQHDLDLYAGFLENKLKSLRLQPHWKPSEEQMEALMLAIEGKWEEILPTGYMSRRLEDLYEGLANTFKVECKLEE